ncbi:Polyadenylate-binding protein rbp47 [Salvia divinorum]|uniref:Polyadenylate-binding protein rbp47 n=1 Tax=Salvia divinorum TaxID=28513 RepID=A0ABD1I0F0_SALDI
MNGGDLNQNQNQSTQQQQHQQLQHQQWVAVQQYQQQWMAMQYPAMAMQQHMMYNQHYVPYYHPQQYQQQPASAQGQKQNNQIQNGAEDNKTIWIGDLQQWMDEGYIHSCFSQSGEVVSAKIIRNKQTGHSERYGFIEFNSHEAAEKVLQSFNGTTMPNTEQPFRLNWAAFSAGDRRPNTTGGGGGDIGSDLSIFVGDLSSDVTDAMLTDTFASRYPSVKGAKVVVDANSGRSKGYGFVRFGDENERTRAMNEMNGVYCSSRPMRIGVATPKKTSPQQQQYSSQAVILAGGGGYANGVVPQGHSENDSANTTIFVGGLDSDVTDEELRQSFTPFGEVVSVKIPAGKGCGFVQYANRSNAEDAIERLNGSVIGKQTVRLSWGRNTGNKQSRMDANGQWNGAYYGRQGYNGYGYAAAGPSYEAPSNGHGNLQQPVS